MRLKEDFFARDARIVARDLLGKVLVRKIDKSFLKVKIVEVEAYLNESDPGSWAKLGKRKDNFAMWERPGKILIKNVHMHKMLNFVTGEEGKAEAVLIRAGEPLNFDNSCSGPGRLTRNLEIDKKFNGKMISEIEGFWIEELGGDENFEIVKDFRIGLREDSEEKRRFILRKIVV